MRHRHSLRLKEFDYSQEGAYFVTICAKRQQCTFGDITNGEMRLNELGKIVEAVWLDLPKHYGNIELDAFVIMPNHIHCIVFIVGAVHEPPNNIRAIQKPPQHNGAIRELPLQRRQMLLSKIIGHFKMNTAKRINHLRKTPSMPVWQRNYFEHIVRNRKSLYHIRQYINKNPQKWALDIENPNAGTGLYETNFWNALKIHSSLYSMKRIEIKSTKENTL